MASSTNRSSKATLKRPPPGPPYSDRKTKLRRTTRRVSMEQRNATNRNSLSSRWISFTIDGFKLLLETVTQFLPGSQVDNSSSIHTHTPLQRAPSPPPPSRAKPLPITIRPHPDDPTLTPRTYLTNLRKTKSNTAARPHTDPRLIPLPPSPTSSERQSKRKSYNFETSEPVPLPRAQQMYSNQGASSSQTRRFNHTGPQAAASSCHPTSKRPRKSPESSPSVEIVSSTIPNPPEVQDRGSWSNGSSQTVSESTKPIPVRRYQNREHIYAKKHKQRIKEEKLADRLEMEKELYNLERRSGYQSSLADFRGLLSYRAALEKVQLREALSPSSSLTDLRELSGASSRIRRYSFADADGLFLQRALEKARATFNSPKPPKPFIPSWEQLQLRNKSTDEEIENRLRPKRPPLPTRLPPVDDAKVDEILQKRGAVFKFDRSQVSSEDLARLRPAQWLNDEIINFYGTMIVGRAVATKENSGGKEQKQLKVHYFNTFFWPKIVEGYDKSRLAKWTKKVDVFEKDIILMAINHGNAHWTSAAINFRRKRIEAYDSMGGDQGEVLDELRGYLDAEHRNKKKRPFDFTGWDSYAPKDTPRQENAYDCGVFTCTILEYLSRGEESFDFSQKHMPYLRRRMILEIATGQLRNQP